MPGPIQAVVETSIYVQDLESTAQFYGGLLGLPILAQEPGRHVFFQVGPGVLLAFLSSATREGGQLPAHGASGAGHFALGVSADDLSNWREHLLASGVAIEREISWPRGGWSIYFRDPAGNSVELITPGVWGTSAGW